MVKVNIVYADDPRTKDRIAAGKVVLAEDLEKPPPKEEKNQDDKLS